MLIISALFVAGLYRTFSNVLLWVLLFLHAWWFLLFVRLLVKVTRSPAHRLTRFRVWMGCSLCVWLVACCSQLLFMPPHETGEDEYEGESGAESEESNKEEYVALASPFWFVLWCGLSLSACLPVRCRTPVARHVRRVCSSPVVTTVSFLIWAGLLFLMFARDRARHSVQA